MGLLLFIMYVIIATGLTLSKKDIFAITLIYIIFAPDIKLGSSDISAIYCLIIYLITIILLSRRNIRINKKNIGYLFLILLNFILYFVMTIICNSEITNSGLASMVGFCKIPVLIILFCSLFPNEIKDPQKYDCAFKTLLIINLIGVGLQFVFGLKIKSFFEGMYLTNNYTYYSTLNGWEVYNRKFGFFASPMLLGMFCLLTFLYFLLRHKKDKNNKYVLWIFLSLLIGLTSLSKTFIIGAPIILILYFILGKSFIKKRQQLSMLDRKKTTRILQICIVLPIMLFIFVLLYNYLIANTTILYYIKMLGNPLVALESRYNLNADNLLLTKTYSVIKENIIFGVGFQSVNNEFLGDSSYVLALHHGGIISFVSIIVFYLLNVLKSLKHKKLPLFMFLIVWIISGLAMPTLYNTILVFPFYLFFFNGEDVNNNENYKIN